MASFNPWMFRHARAPFSGQRQSWKQGENFLQNTFHFPSFRDLPHENNLDERYWQCDLSGVYVPACTWFFMAEITNDECSQSAFLRNQVRVTDRAGQRDIPIYFYPEGGSFDYKLLKKGSTILVANGQKHDFLDLSIGLRIEELDTVSVAPCSMDQLLALSKTYHANKETKCWLCGKEGESNGSSQMTGAQSSSGAGGAEELKKCGACRVAHYCSRECQEKHWKEGGHKRTCKAMPVFTKLTKINYSIYDSTAFLGPAHFIPGLARK
jgi:hypothetical protein